LEKQILIVLILLVVLRYLIRYVKQPKWKKPKHPLSNVEREILRKYVKYYNLLSDEDKKKFEYKVQEFLLNVKIIGVDTEITTKDKILIASSAIIPIFAFKNWKYKNLKEVIVYPDTFNLNFETTGENKNIKGLVGTGHFEGKMLLSKKALLQGFSNDTDKKNTAIHEFIHLIDKADGKVDGIPALLLEEPYQLPWLDYIYKQIKQIQNKKSDINTYGATNEMEFFSVASEYFFERPLLLKKKHPELYKYLEHIFKQDTAALFLNGRNSLKSS